MALFIAKAPQYRSRQSVPKNIGVPVADLRASRAENEAINRLGTLLVTRADEMKKERDAAVVGDLYNQWRDADREQLSQLLQKKGKDAVNLDQDYDQFFTKSQGKADQSAENGSQQAMVNDMLSRKRDQNLDILARYEVAEGQRYKEAQGQGIIANAVSDGRDAGFDDVKLNASIAEEHAWFRAAHPGASDEEISAHAKMVESEVKYANMQSRINENPTAALITLEKWKEDLGKGYFILKDNAEAAVKDKLVQDLRVFLNDKYTEGTIPNFNKMEDAIQKDKTIPDDIKDQVVTWVRAQEREYDGRVAKVKADTQDSEMDTIFGFLREGKVTDAYRAVLDATQLSEVQRYRIENIIKSSKKGAGETDSDVFINTAKLAMTAQVGRNDIINLIGNGLSVSDGENLLNQLKIAEAPGREELNKSIKDATDAVEKQIVKGNQLVGYDSASVDDAYKAVKQLQKALSNPPQGVTVQDMLNPENPNYILDRIIKDNLIPLDEQIKRMTDAYKINQGAEARKQGESITDYEKRLKK